MQKPALCKLGEVLEVDDTLRQCIERTWVNKSAKLFVIGVALRVCVLHLFVYHFR